MSTAGLQCFDENGLLLFTSGDGLARIVLVGQTGGAETGAVFVQQWQDGQRPWFTAVLYGFAYQTPTPYFYIDGPNLRWNSTTRGWGAPNIQYIIGVW